MVKPPFWFVIALTFVCNQCKLAPSNPKLSLELFATIITPLKVVCDTIENGISSKKLPTMKFFIILF